MELPAQKVHEDNRSFWQWMPMNYWHRIIFHFQKRNVRYSREQDRAVFLDTVTKNTDRLLDKAQNARYNFWLQDSCKKWLSCFTNVYYDAMCRWHIKNYLLKSAGKSFAALKVMLLRAASGGKDGRKEELTNLCRT